MRPPGLIRYWDSLESETSEYNAQHKKSLDRSQSDWLTHLSNSTENECMSILYAKSLIEEEESDSGVDTLNRKTGKPSSATTVTVGGKSRPKSSISSSMSNLHAPPKPQRCIARLKSTKGNGPAGPPSYSALDLHRDCSQAARKESTSSNYALNEFDPLEATQSVNSLQWVPPGLRASQPLAPSVSLSSTRAASHSALMPAGKPPQPPSYEQLPLRVKSRRAVASGGGLRHTIAVNQDDLEQACNIQMRHSSIDSRVADSSSSSSNGLATVAQSPRQNRRKTQPLPPPSPKSPRSPRSMRAERAERQREREREEGEADRHSVDSGQGSGEIRLSSGLSAASTHSLPMGDIAEDEDSEATQAFCHYQRQCLPGYARVASTMDHVLRTCSSIYSLLPSRRPAAVRDLLAKALALCHIIDTSPVSAFIPKYDLSVVRLQCSSAQREAAETSAPPEVNDYLSIALRKACAMVLTVFAKILCRYLSDCQNRDRLLSIALEHLIHLVLFGDELCLETVQHGGVHSLVRLLRPTTTPSETRRLLLRALAVLCGIGKGCLQLLSLGGLPLILEHLTKGPTACSVEAAGVLTQLASPAHSLVQLNGLDDIIKRLLDLVDECSTAESLLLCGACLAHVSLHGASAVQALYTHNACSRLLEAHGRSGCNTIFVQEQMVSVLSRLAARGFEECLVAQGAVPVLLELLTVTDQQHADYCRRIRYKAAVCIGTLSASGVGLKALYVHHAYAILCHVLDSEASAVGNPLGMICSSIRTRLENKYQIESAV